jgi:hypothetical protein
MIAGITGHPCQRLFFVDAKWPLPTPSGLAFGGIYQIAVIASSIDSTTLRKCSIDCLSRGHLRSFFGAGIRWDQ